MTGLYEVFKEVNADFFAVIPLEKILTGYRDTVMEIINSNLSTLSAQSLPPATALPPGTMDGDFLSDVSEPYVKSSKKK